MAHWMLMDQALIAFGLQRIVGWYSIDEIPHTHTHTHTHTVENQFNKWDHCEQQQTIVEYAT